MRMLSVWRIHEDQHLLTALTLYMTTIARCTKKNHDGYVRSSLKHVRIRTCACMSACVLACVSVCRCEGAQVCGCAGLKLPQPLILN